MELKTVELERIQIAFQQMVGKYMLEPRVEIALDWMLEHLEIDIRGYLWGEHQKDYVIKYPADWWEAFKERWMPDWLKERYPIRYEVKEYSVKVIYPDLKISLPDRHHVVLINENAHLSYGGDDVQI